MSYGLLWYLLGMLGGINKIAHMFFVMGAIVSVPAGVILAATSLDHGLEPPESARQSDIENHKLWQAVFGVWKKVAAVTAVLMLLGIALPSKKDAMIILGLNLAQSPIEEVMKDAGEFYDPLKALLKQELEGLIEVKSGGKK